jgi:hypothetical protein
MPQPKRVYLKNQRRAAKRRQSRSDRLRQRQEAAQSYIRNFERSLEDLGLERRLVQSLSRKIRIQGKLMRKVFAMMFPPLFGARSYQELGRILGWSRDLPGRILGALPKARWLEKLQRLGREIVETLWARIEQMSAATRSRWQMTWVADDSVFRKHGAKLRLVGSWYSGQEKRAVLGVDGLLLMVVFGDGKLAVPVDFAVRRPDPVGPGRPSKGKVEWLETMLRRSVGALEVRGLHLCPPIVVADAQVWELVLDGDSQGTRWRRDDALRGQEQSRLHRRGWPQAHRQGTAPRP